MAWNWLTPWRAKRKSRQSAPEPVRPNGEKWEPPKPTPDDGVMYKYLYETLESDYLRSLLGRGKQ
jgi:hypothetical protein